MIINDIKQLHSLGFKIFGTSGTSKFLNSAGIKCKTINKVYQGSPHIVDSLNEGRISVVINTSEGSKSISDSFSLRRSALINKVPYFTTLASTKACVEAITSKRKNILEVRALQET